MAATVTLRVEGMTCGACVKSIEAGLAGQVGINNVSVALLAEKATVEYDPSLWSPEKLASEIEDLGFEATPLEAPPETKGGDDVVALSVYGMTCASCTSAVEKGLLSMPGVKAVSVSLTPGRCHITYDRLALGVRDLVEEIESLGFDAVVSSEESNLIQLQSLARTKEVQAWRHAFWRSLTFALPVFIISMIAPMVPLLRPIVNFRFFTGVYLGDMVCLALTIPVQFGIGLRLYRSAWKAIKHKAPTMDVLVMFGTSAAFSYSIFVILYTIVAGKPDDHPKPFFDTSTMVITFISFGRYLENMAKGKTSAALSQLISLTPSKTTIYTDAPACTAEKTISTDLVQVNDYVKIVPGDKIPADGFLIKGESSVDESMVTGEAMPIVKRIGDQVIGGTVNGAGTFDMRVSRAGKDTALSQIVKLVEDAQTSKAPIQAFADTVAGYFVPVVIGLSIVTFLVWMIIAHTTSKLPHVFHEEGANTFMVCLRLCISVVVVACPCALGLSTPTAVMVGTGVGAQNGILIKGSGPLEASHKIDRILLDKTGTLTLGKLEVSGMRWNESVLSPQRIGSRVSIDVPRAVRGGSDWSALQGDVLLMVAAAESKSEHPLAKALGAFAKRAIGFVDLPAHTFVTDFESVTGSGIQCTVNGKFSNSQKSTKHQVLIGNAQFLAKHKINIPSYIAAFREREEALGRTAVFVAVDDALSCAVSLADTIKAEARQAIDALRDMGIKVALVTGDQSATAQSIAADIGIPAEDVYSGVKPDGKRDLVQSFQASGHTVAMVGDGVNDSPALAAADVGIALCSGTDIAIEAADIVLMRADLLDVVAAIDLSRAIFSKIRSNFFWAAIYNVLGIPMAMGCLLPWGIHLHPMLAAAAMAMSSVSVVTSSLMLRTWQKPDSTNSRRTRRNAGMASSLHGVAQRAVDYVRSRNSKNQGYLPAVRENGSLEAFPLMNNSSVALHSPTNVMA